MMKKFAVVLLLSWLSGALISCAHSQKQWDQDFMAENPTTAASNKVLDIPFISQEEHMCGPSVLKMATSFSAPTYSLAEIEKMTFREDAQGTFQSDILSAARRMGLTPYRVNTTAEMWKQIREERPVIVFQNLGLSWLPAWHFSLLVGYDAAKDRVIMHTGHEAYQSIGLSRFMGTWERGEKWSYVVTSPEDVPTNARFEDALENAMLLEKMENLNAAQSVYAVLSTRFPDRFEPHLGLAQIHYARKNLELALSEAETALSKSPEHPALLFNVSQLNFEKGNLQKAKELKNQTLTRVSQEERANYEQKFTF
jgi:tetratricopeptide (TPR) repeat protein